MDSHSAIDSALDSVIDDEDEDEDEDDSDGEYMECNQSAASQSEDENEDDDDDDDDVTGEYFSHSEDEGIGDGEFTDYGEATDYTDYDDDDEDDAASCEEYSASGSVTTGKESEHTGVTGTTTAGGNDDYDYDQQFCDSFSTDATEDRGHVSKTKVMMVPTRNNSNVSSESLSADNSNVASTGSTASTASPQKQQQQQQQQQQQHHELPHQPQSRVPRILTNHQRVPGGAAAKLIGIKNKSDDEDENYQFVNDGDDALEVVAPLDELIKSRDMAKVEFSVGSTENKRYHNRAGAGASSTSNSAVTPTLSSDGILPRILDRDEVFHENAAAAIVSILTPSRKSSNTNYNNIAEIEAILTARSSDIELSKNPSNRSAVEKQKQIKKNKDSSSPFARPAAKKKICSSAVTTVGSDGNSAVEDAIETMTSTGKNPLVQNLLSKKTERHLATIKNRMKDPTKHLTDLMEAIASPKSGLFDRHYMVRRKNACGALKVLTANVSHRVNICWTLGVLPALSSVLEDSGPDTLQEQYPNATIQREYIEARKRAVSSLVYLAIPKNNKLPIFHCPRLVASLVRVIEQDDGEARRGCCAVLANLSKSKENRLIMAQIPGLLDALSTVIAPKECYWRSVGNDDEDTLSTNSDESEAFRRDILDRLSNEDDGNHNKIDMSLSGKSGRRRLGSEDPAELSARYDEDPNTFLHGARQNVFACLNHLVKEKDNAYILARHHRLVHTLVSITRLQESLSQEYALKLLAHLSRHRSNSKVLVFKMKHLVPAVVFATHSPNPESRIHACYALQNFSQDKPCRQQLVSVDDLLPAICLRIRSVKYPGEKLAALHTLKNLTDEPANLIPMTNTPECFATLMHVAHAGDNNTTEMMQYLGCDALATLSHWFRSIATSGQRIGTMQQNPSESNSSKAKDDLFVPTLRVLSWERWQ